MGELKGTGMGNYGDSSGQQSDNLVLRHDAKVLAAFTLQSM